MDEKTMEKIIAEVLCAMRKNSTVRCCDLQSGIMSIDSSKVEMEPFDTGKPGDKVWLKDVITAEDNKNLAAGYMKIEETEFPWTLTYDEIDYIIEGELTIKIREKEITARAGDLLLIPAGSEIIWSAKEYAKFVFVTYPANWADLV